MESVADVDKSIWFWLIEELVVGPMWTKSKIHLPHVIFLPGKSCQKFLGAIDKTTAPTSPCAISVPCDSPVLASRYIGTSDIGH